MNKYSRPLSFILLIIMVFAGSLSVYANDSISVYIDDTRLDFDVPPQIVDGRTMVPMRKIFESLGAGISWDEKTRTVTGEKDGIIVNVSIDSKILFKNGVPKALDVAPVIVDGRTLVPARAIAESFDCQVDWIAETKTVKIITDGKSIEKTPLSAMQISEKVSPSVFYIEVYDSRHEPLGSGSGFFVSSNGVAVTNYHVIEETYFASITTINGERHNVTDVIAFDKDLDIAIIRVDKQAQSGKVVSGFPSVSLANSDDVKAGQTVYALGSPVGLQNTISDGIVSNINQIVGEDSFIQTTAPISHGSSGGALVNEYGEVLGITSAGIVAEGAQNIGFAIPVNNIKLFDLNADGIPYSQFVSKASQFVLEVNTQTLELNVGETAEIYVYAEGKGDWSIYWDTEEKYIVDCEWGDWLDGHDNVCPLYITAKNPGTATVTVYSDVDFNGIDITINVRNSYRLPTYPSSCTSVPTYTSITGVQPYNYREFESSVMYAYKYYDVNTVQTYIDYLLANGYTFHSKDEDDSSTAYYYKTPENVLISVCLAFKWNELWIYLPR